MSQAEEVLPACQYQTENLSLIAGTYVRLEGENQLHKVVFLTLTCVPWYLYSHIPLHIIKNFKSLFWVYGSFVCMYVCAPVACSTLRSQRTVWDPLKVRLQAIRGLSPVCWESSLSPPEEPVLFRAESSLQPSSSSPQLKKLRYPLFPKAQYVYPDFLCIRMLATCLSIHVLEESRMKSMTDPLEPYGAEARSGYHG